MRLMLSLLLAAERSTVVVPFSAGSSRSFCGSSALHRVRMCMLAPSLPHAYQRAAVVLQLSWRSEHPQL